MIRRLARPFLVVAVVWAVVGLVYLFRTPETLRAHDAAAHIGFTRVLIEQGRLPMVEETYQSWQPPLFYYVASVLAPGTDFHTTAVRLLSWVFGLVTLALIYYNLRRYRVPALASVLALVFLATTPKFVMYFTTYNNDAAVGALAVAIITVFLHLRERWDPRLAALLWVLSVIAVNVKLTVGVLFVAIFAILVIDWWTRPAVRRQVVTLMAIGLTVPLTVLPWMILHNLPSTGQLLPTPFAAMPTEYLLVEPPWRVLTFPAITNGEWIDPYAYSAPVDGIRWKANNFWSFLFVTSIYGEYIWSSPPHEVFWALVWLHAAVLVVALRETGRNLFTLDMGTLFVLAVIFLIPYPMLEPYIPNMDFRYIGWAWLPYVALVASAVTRREERPVPIWLYVILGGATLLHLLVVFFPESCCW